jgi:hypothetical protein
MQAKCRDAMYSVRHNAAWPLYPLLLPLYPCCEAALALTTWSEATKFRMATLPLTLHPCREATYGFPR